MKKFPCVNTLAIATLAACLSACGGQAPEDASQQPSKDHEPEAAAFEVLFPAPFANIGTGRSETSTTVAVRSFQPTTTLTVNGVSLQVSSQDPNLWYGRVAVSYGDNLLDFNATTETGNHHLQQMLTNVSVQLPDLKALRIAKSGAQYLLDASGRIHEWVVDKGEMRSLGDDKCAGQMLEVSADGYRGFVLDRTQLCEIDLPTGSARYISLLPESSDGEVRNLGFYFDQNALYISRLRRTTASPAALELVRVNPRDDSVTTLFNSEDAGVNLLDMSALAMDTTSNTAYYHDAQGALSAKGATTPALMALNLITGETRTVTELDERPFRSVLNGDGTLTTYNYLDQPGVKIDLQTGAMTVLSPGTTRSPATALVGSGPRFQANSLALDESGKSIYATSTAGLFRIALATGEREWVAPMACENKCDIEVDVGYAYVFETEQSRKAVYKVDLSDGDKTLVSNLNRGRGETPGSAMGAAIDTRNGRLLVADFWGNTMEQFTPDYGPVLSVDLATGNRENFWWDENAELPFYTSYPAADVWVDNHNGCLYVWEPLVDTVLTMDFASPAPGEYQSIDVTWAERSSSPGYSAMAIDNANDHLYLTNRAGMALVRVPVQKTSEAACYRLDRSERVELVTGERLGTGIDLPEVFLTGSTNPPGNNTLALDSHNQVAYMVGRQGEIIAVSLLTGDRVVIAN